MTDSLSLGHRERLKNKFLNGNQLEDYELLELLLMYAIPRKDVKPLAKSLLIQFGSLGGVLTANTDDLIQVNGIKETSAILLKLTGAVNQAILKKDLISKKSLATWEEIENYCYALLGRQTKEYVYLVMLDSDCCLIDAIQMQKGTVNQTPFYIREVIETLLKYHAVSFILVHNHPHGNPKPSVADIKMTQELQETTEKMNIIMQDHFIVSPSGMNSFQMMGLMKRNRK